MKKSAEVLHYFGLGCGMLEFLKYSTHEEIGRLDRFLYEAD
jgi:hypothetical protein